MIKDVRFLIISISFLLIFSIDTNPSLAALDWIWPVKGEIITSFNFDILSYYARGNHTGIDIESDEGTVVFAPMDGRVYWVAKNPFGRGGAGISIDHENNISTTYFGLKEPMVEKGSLVKQGDIIAVIGNEGDKISSNVTHLHFGVFKTSSRSSQKTEYMDPISLLSTLSLNDENLNTNESSEEITSTQKSEFTNTIQPDVATNISIKESKNIKKPVNESKPESKILSSDKEAKKLPKSNVRIINEKSGIKKSFITAVSGNSLKVVKNAKLFKKVNKTTKANLYNQLLDNYVRSVSKNSFNENQSENINRLFIPIIALVSLILLRSQSLISMKPNFASFATAW